MTPKEKAKDLVDNYRIVLQITDTEVGEEILCTLVAKSCAKIAVDEIIGECSKFFEAISESRVEYWKQVQTEISKL